MARSRRWSVHFVCVALLAVEVGFAVLWHRTDAELERAAAEGTPRERVAALHVLTNRGEVDPQRFDQTFVEALLASEEPLLREFAYTTDVCKYSEPRAQYQTLKDLTERPSDPEFWRTFVFHRRKVGVVLGGSSARLRYVELMWYLDARAGRAMPGEVLLRQIEATP